MNIFEYPHIKEATTFVLKDLQYKKNLVLLLLWE